MLQNCLTLVLVADHYHFSSCNWINGNDDTMNDICTTFHDYFDDFSTRCNPRTLVKLIGICYNRLLIEYIGHLIQACTKKNRKTGSRSVMMNGSNVFSPSIFKAHDITESIRLDLQNAKMMFEQASETAEHRTGRSFRHQTQLDGWFQDLIYRTHVEDIHENIFRPIQKMQKNTLINNLILNKFYLSSFDEFLLKYFL